MDMIAYGVGMYMLVAVGLWSLVSGWAGAFAYKRTNNIGLSATAGLAPLCLAWAIVSAVQLWPDKPQVTVINGKAYTPETLPQPPMNFPQAWVGDDPKNLDVLQTFGIDPPSIELCRKKGCRVVFTPKGGISSYGPVRAGDWQYSLDPATEKWKLKE